jgi:acyl dehydratase
MGTTTTIAALSSLAGTGLGVSDWIEVSQDLVNTFADTTGHHQWIRVDVERAERESPSGGPIATLSSVTTFEGGVQITGAEGVEAEGVDKPVCVAEPLFRCYQ